MALAWKVSWEQSLKGSNPLSSAIIDFNARGEGNEKKNKRLNNKN
jgi:hypothetical protein